MKKYIPLIAVLIIAGIIFFSLWAMAGAENINIGCEITQTMTEQEFYASLEPVSSNCNVPILNTCVNF